MSKSIVRLGIVSLLSASVVLTAIPAVSAAVKRPVTPKKRVVLGTKQLNGDQAQFGLTYTLGKKDPINVTLDSAEYTVEPVRCGRDFIVPKSDQKLLVLHYTLHNPNPRDRGLAWSTLEINAVDANDTNWRFATFVGMEATGEKCYMSLKPAQKTKVYTCITVPANGQIPKLIFQSSDKLVLRYDIRGKVKPLPAPIADPADATGATALEKVPAQIGTFYPMKTLHNKIDSVEFSTAPFKGEAPKSGYRYLVITATAKNNLLGNESMRWSTFAPKLTDADGAEIRWNGDVYFASRDATVVTDIEPGQELRYRYVYKVPVDMQLKSLALSQSNGRAYVYDLTQVK